MRKQISFYVDERDFKVFATRYPNLASTFFRRCLVKACQDTEFFQHTFFEVKDSCFDNVNSFSKNHS